MKLVRHTILALALVLNSVATAGAAQDQGPDQGAPSNPVRPSKKTAPAPVSITIHLAGIEAQAGPKLLKDVRALQQTLYGCIDCKFTGRHGGACPVCAADLVERGKPEVFQQVKLSIDRRYLDAKLHPGRWGSLREIETPVEAAGGKVKRADMRVPTYARIALKGLGAADAEKASAVLRDAKLFRDVAIVSDEAAGHTWIVPKLEADGSVPKSVKLGAVTEELAKVADGVSIVDVQWTTPCVFCAKNGAIRTGCRTCWPD